MSLIKRESNIELLRIVAMVMIVIYHVLAHGIAPAGELSHVVLLLLYTPFIFGVNLFVLISGYFGIRLSWRSYFSLMWIIGFYKLFHLFTDTFVLGISHSLFEWFAKPLSGPVSGGGWFVDIYVLLMLIAPLLNKLLTVLSRREYLMGLATLLILNVGYGFGLNMHFDASGYSLLHFIVLYFIGYGLKCSYILSSKQSGWWYICTLIILWLLIIFFSANYWVTHLTTSYASPLVLFGAVSFFSFLARKPIGYHPAINFIAISMLPVYLIHEGGNLSHWYYQKISEWFKELSLTNFIIHTFLLILSLYALAIFIDQPRKWIWQKLQKLSFSSYSLKMK